MDRFRIAVVVLHRHLDGSVVNGLFVVEGNELQYPAIAIVVAHQVGYAAVKEISAFDIPVSALVMPVADEADFQPLVEIGNILEVPRQFVEFVVNLAENLRVGAEADCRPMEFRSLLFDKGRSRNATGKFLGEQEPIATHLCAQEFRKPVHDRCANTVQSASDLVGPTAEFAAGMQGGHHCFEGILACGGMNIHRDPPAIVGNGDQPIFRNVHINPGAVAGHGLIHRIVQDLDHQMLQTA